MIGAFVAFLTMMRPRNINEFIEAFRANHDDIIPPLCDGD